jgi:hypothetical protein
LEGLVASVPDPTTLLLLGLGAVMWFDSFDWFDPR